MTTLNINTVIYYDTRQSLISNRNLQHNSFSVNLNKINRFNGSNNKIEVRELKKIHIQKNIKHTSVRA